MIFLFIKNKDLNWANCLAKNQKHFFINQNTVVEMVQHLTNFFLGKNYLMLPPNLLFLSKISLK